MSHSLGCIVISHLHARPLSEPFSAVVCFAAFRKQASLTPVMCSQVSRSPPHLWLSLRFPCDFWGSLLFLGVLSIPLLAFQPGTFLLDTAKLFSCLEPWVLPWDHKGKCFAPMTNHNSSLSTPCASWVLEQWFPSVEVHFNVSISVASKNYSRKRS